MQKKIRLVYNDLNMTEYKNDKRKILIIYVVQNLNFQEPMVKVCSL
jgi:hypothetical protein